MRIWLVAVLGLLVLLSGSSRAQAQGWSGIFDPGTLLVLHLQMDPLDWAAIAGTVKNTGKVLLVGEDSRTGSILESIASRISESLYEHLDGPVRVLGALDASVPYAPSLEDAFLVSDELLTGTARALLEG